MCYLLCTNERRVNSLLIKIEDKTSASVMKQLINFESCMEPNGIKSITTDNGSEFVNLSDLEQVTKALVYYSHPYISAIKEA